MKNKTRIKDAKRKNRNKTQKFKGGGFFGSLGSFFKSNVSPALTEFLKLKIISDDIQKVYDAKNKDQATFTQKMNVLKENLKKLNASIASVEIEKKLNVEKSQANAQAKSQANAQANTRVPPAQIQHLQ